MSRKNRMTAPPFHSWHGLPRELPQQLYHVSLFARAVAVELFRCSDHDYAGRISTHGDRWDVSLCRTLQVEGPERRNVCGALKQLKGAGVLLVHRDCVTICLGQSLDGLPEQIADDSAPVGSQSVSTRSPLGPHSDSTRVPPEVKYAESLKVGPANRIDRIEEKEVQQRAPARARDVGIGDRPELKGFRFTASLLGRSEFDISPLGSYARQYAWIGHRPEAEREAVRKAVEADTWCRQNPHKVDAPHLERRWQSYLHGDAKPVLKPVVAPKPEPRGIWAKAGAQ